MPSYKNGKIYKLRSNQIDKIYIGSTKQSLNHRFSAHKYDYATKRYNCSSFEILKFEDCKIELIEKYSCNSKYELREQEQFHIEQNKNICVNIFNAFLTEEQRKENKNEYNKNYYINNKERLTEYEKNYSQIRIECIYCDEISTKKNYKRHCKSEKHKQNVEFFDNIFNL